MWILAATRAESAAAALSLAALSSCVLLAIYRPRRTELEGTPHRVPLIAVVIAIGWAMLAASAVYGTSPPDEPAKLLTIGDLWSICALSLVEMTIIAGAYLIPRAVHRPAAPDVLSSQEPVPAEIDDTAEETHDPAVAAAPRKCTYLPEDWPDHLAVGVTVGLAALLPTALLAGILVPERDLNDSHILLRSIQGKGWDYLLPTILAASFFAPLKEELLFRVIVQGRFADLIGKWAIPLTAAMFAFIHGPNDASLLIPLSLILGALYEWRRSYLEVAAAHAAFNAANLFAAVNAS